MLSTRCTAALVLSVALALACVSISAAADYDARFMRNYPPGYYGMWYYADRFTEKEVPDKVPEELWRWDKYMTRITELQFPFFPIPYDWEYGTGRTFHLPDYNANNWPY